MLFLGFQAHALDSLDRLGGELGVTSGTARQDAIQLLSERAGTVINNGLALLGTFLLALIVYAGALWMFAGGDSTRVDKAKKIIRGAVIALVIITSAFVITTFVVSLAQ